MMNTVVQIFLKAPEPGKVKTRLIPDIGLTGATAVHVRLVEHILSVSCLAQVDQVQCWVAGDITHPFIKKLGLSYSIFEQSGKDLGERMHYALNQGLRDFERVVLIGADAYSVDQQYIHTAFECLEHHDIVLGPAQDGGYILIGASKLNHFVFSDIDWGSHKVLRQQIQRLDQYSIDYRLLEKRWDIDVFEDIQNYAPSLIEALSLAGKSD